jgi:hypothetical protein
MKKTNELAGLIALCLDRLEFFLIAVLGIGFEFLLVLVRV